MIVRDQLLDQATTATGLDDFGDVPFLEALDALVDSLNRDATRRRRGAGRRRRDDHRHPREAAAPRRRPQAVPRDRARRLITAPVFIVGQPRSGSTHLHALLACVEGVRAPRSWEMSAPSPPPERATFDTDPRIATVQAGDRHRCRPEMLVRHPMSATRPEQCNGLFDWTFINQAWMASYDIRSYRDWFLDADYAPMYEAHHRTLQHLQWQQPGPVGAQVPEASAVARRVARRVSRCGADLDPSRPGRGACRRR